MSIIYHKVWRDLWRNKTRTILAMLSTAVGILALGMVVSMSDLMTGRMTGEWLASQPAYVSVSIIGEQMTECEMCHREHRVGSRHRGGGHVAYAHLDDVVRN